MRNLLFISFILIMFCVNAQDTTYVQTFTLDSTSRAGVFTFPDDPSASYEKIIMQYRMRCHNAAVGNGNVGCREWDYHCNTVITDSSLTDSVWSIHPNYVVTGSSSNPFYYINNPTFNYIRYVQQEVSYNAIMTEDSFAIGNGNLSLSLPFQTETKKLKYHVLYKADELLLSGMSSGNISGLRLDLDEVGDEVEFLKIKMKHVTFDILSAISPDLKGFTEVFFHDTDFLTTGKHSFNFYQSFNWNGTDNILVEFSFNKEDQGSNNLIKGESTGSEVLSVFTEDEDGFISVNQGDYIDVPAEAFSSVDSLLTISFWQYGDPDFQPFNSYIFEGADINNNRVVNCHLPWSNSRVYWDAGNSGTNSFDRIDKEAAFEDFAGQWNHWAMTKNVITGEMKLYLNGELWHSGSGLVRSMEGIVKFKIAGNKNNGQYAGFINEFRIWKQELDEETIKEWMFKDVEIDHPFYDDLLVYYKMNDVNGNVVLDDGPGNHNGMLSGQPLYVDFKGHQLNRNFQEKFNRPNIEFVKGIYSQSIVETYSLDSLQRPYNSVYSYYVENNDLIPNDTTIHWEAGYMPVYAESGIQVDSIFIDPEGQLDIENLEYYRKWPSRFELLSFITPYGNGLDLGEEGVMWEFDVSDFGPILKGDKYLSIEGAGKSSEELDIRFLYIEGTPPRDVLTINPIWPMAKANQTWYGFGPGAIQDDLVFEPRDIQMNPEATYFKVRSAITGHGQSGEFVPKWHYIDVDGDDIEFLYKVWKECSTIPIYPQGGTWIFDRAGWCPGDPTTLFEFDLTEYVVPGQVHTLDYGLTNISGLTSADYRVANQLVTYGPANFSLDAAVVDVQNPNMEIAAHKRFNPACTDVEVIIQNTGETPLSSLELEYWVEGGDAQTFSWTGNLEFLQKENIRIPITDYSFWLGSSNVFHVQISEPNGGVDEYPNNNSYKVEFESTDVYDIDESLEVHCLTNNLAFQNSYYLEDAQGNIIFERDNLENTTLYTDVLTLEPGCYKLRIDDSGDNGLYYWFNTGQGSGYLRLKNSAGYIMENFEPEFGRFAEYEFAVLDLTGKKEVQEYSRISLFPNPVKHTLSLDLNGFTGNTFNITILDASMKPVLNEQFISEGSSFEKQMDLHNLPAGVYFVRIMVGEKVFTKKLVKL